MNHDATTILLAKAVLASAFTYDVSKGRNAYNECNHCEQHVYWDEPVDLIEHKDDCPVPVARRVLYGRD